MCAVVTKKKSIEDMQNLAAGRDGRCLSDSYMEARSKHRWECSAEHQWWANPASIKKGTWCPECYVSPLTIRKQERTR